MKALVKTGPGPGLELVDIPVPAIGASDVLVEVKFCHSPLGYDYVCPYVENIVAGVGAGEVNLRGGWHADFASQYSDGTLTQVKGTGSDNPVMLLTAAGATIRVTDAPGMERWRKRVFVAIWRNAANPVEYFHLPDRRTITMGWQTPL